MYLNKWIYILGYGSKLTLTREVINGNGPLLTMYYIHYPIVN